MLLVLLGGGGLIALFRANPPPLTRGASAGEHWHSSYKIYICGKRMTNYPTVEGEIHSHADGFIHIHPSTPAATGDNANLRNFLLLYETGLVQEPGGKNTLTFPDGTSYSDGDTCPKSKGEDEETKYDLELYNKGKRVDIADIGAFVLHDGDAIEIRFGPKGEKPLPNPYSKLKGVEDVGAATGTPAQD